MTEDVVYEETLDPEDWEAMRKLGHEMLDDMLTYLQRLRSEPSGFPPQKLLRRFVFLFHERGMVNAHAWLRQIYKCARPDFQ